MIEHTLKILGRTDQPIEVTEEQCDDSFHLWATYEGREFCSSGEFFEDALDELLLQLPSGVVSVMCGNCRLGLLDPFGSSNGRDDISCFCDAPELAQEFEKTGKKASPAVFNFMCRRAVEAFDCCDKFTPR